MVRADFERALADPADPAIASAEIASELRRGADYVGVALTVTVTATDVADALAIAWDAFRVAARHDLAGWEVIAATAQVQPERPLNPQAKVRVAARPMLPPVSVMTQTFPASRPAISVTSVS